MPNHETITEGNCESGLINKALGSNGSSIVSILFPFNPINFPINLTVLRFTAHAPIRTLDCSSFNTVYSDQSMHNYD